MDNQLELEFWNGIPDYEGFYEESSLGRTRNIRTGRVLKPTKTRNGYLYVSLWKNNVGKKFLVHRLVWTTFVGEIPEGYELDHINTERVCNRLSNLRVVTRKENCNNHLTKKHHSVSVKKSNGKPVLQIDNSTGEVIQRFECAADASRELSINHRTISNCCHGKQKTAGGYRFSFFYPPALIQNSSETSAI